MSKLPVISGIDLIKFLTKNYGFEVKRSKGSHAWLESNSGKKTSVPLHSELARGTLGAILEQVGVERDEFIRLYTR